MTLSVFLINPWVYPNVKVGCGNLNFNIFKACCLSVCISNLYGVCEVFSTTYCEDTYMLLIPRTSADLVDKRIILMQNILKDIVLNFMRTSF